MESPPRSAVSDARLSQGDLMEAKKLLRSPFQSIKPLDDKEGVVLNLDSLGDIWRQNGELDKAEGQTYQQAEVIARKVRIRTQLHSC